MGAAAPDALAKQLRDCAVKKHEYSVASVRELVEGWRSDPGLEPEAYVNIGNANGKAPLHFAAQLRDDGLTELLLELRADAQCTTARGHTPLIYACGRGRNGPVLALLHAGARCRVQTANGDTAQRMAAGRLPLETLEALDRAEAGEQGVWLDFMADERAIAAQADHVQRSPHSAKWSCDVPPAVADLLEQRRSAAAQRTPEADAAAALAAELLPRWHDSSGLAEVLLRAARPLSRRRAVATARAALLAAVQDPGAGGPEERQLALLRTAGPAMTEAARSLCAAGELGPRAAKEAKVAVTSAVLSVLRELRTAATLPVPALAAHAPAWMVVELLSPPDGVDLEEHGAALEGVLRRLCHERAWGSDFGTALRWLAALRPGEPAAPAAAAAFDGLAAAFVEVAVAACRAGHSFRRYLKDDGALLREAAEVLGEASARPLLEVCGDGAPRLARGGVRRSRGEPPFPVPVALPEAPFLRLPEGAQVLWIDGAEAWSLAEARLAAARVVAVDTEWWDAGSGPALVQLAVGEGLSGATCFLLDTLNAPQVLGPGLRHLFTREDVEILGWSFGEDRRRLAELCSACGEAACADAACDPEFFAATDLQPLACRLLGASSLVSLAVACARFLGGPLDKTQQCSDWRRRPLAKEQEEYAALDAAVLLELHAALLRCGGGGSPNGGSAPCALEEARREGLEVAVGVPLAVAE